MEKIVREPLVQFMVLGTILFGVFSVIGQWNFEKPAQIVVTPQRIQMLYDGYKIDFNREPTPEELDNLIEDYIREEVLVREAVKLDLHMEDQKVRLQLRSRMEETNAQVPVPTDAELEQFVQANPEKFRTSPDQPLPALERIKPTALSVWRATKRKEMLDAAYQDLLKNYSVVIQRSKSPATQSTTG